MSSITPENWHTANYHYLIAALNQLQIDFFPTAFANNEEKPSLIPSAIGLDKKQISQMQLERLCHVFDLSVFERNLLLLCIGFELLPDFPQYCAQTLCKKEVADHPDLAMALRLFSVNEAASLNPRSPLFYWQLLKTDKTRPLLTQPLRVSEAVLHYLMGYPMQDSQIASLLKPLSAENQPAITSCYAEQIQHITQLWQGPATAALLLHLTGSDVACQRQIIAQSCNNLQFPLYAIDPHTIPADNTAWQNWLQLLVRETWLHFNRVYLIESDSIPAEKQHAMVQLVQTLPANCVLIGQTTLPGINYPLTTIAVPALTAQQQYQLWEQILSEQQHPGPEVLAQISAQFNLSASQIQQIAQTFKMSAAPDQIASDAVSLWQHCRQQLRRNVEGLVQVIEPRANWQDLSLPSSQMAVLKTLVTQVKQRSTVYQQWGFAGKSRRGLGICALFTGPSGTGKTLAAEVIAHELQLDIYHIDLSTIVSKYIGETEKHLKQIFDHAEASGAILLFDEADALFGKRTAVKDSHDHYANLQVNYLLQRIESYGGLSILTTNLKTALDEAFLRRIRFIVPFSFPDHQQRIQIWQCAFPASTPLKDLDWDKLARLNLAGGHIRNISLNSAFFAAAQQQPVMMSHVLQATQSEYIKLERVLTEIEVRDWV
jgi:ATP-dependent 26S proteasome regulatory subunit